jgi:hypothetical protein
MASPAADLIALDTPGKLAAHGHGLSGHCRSCRRYFAVPVPCRSRVSLIAHRGAKPFLYPAGVSISLKTSLGDAPHGLVDGQKEG